jgi:hypothetical protein
MFVFSTTSFLVPVVLVMMKRANDKYTRGSSSEYSEDTSSSRASKIVNKINGFFVIVKTVLYFSFFQEHSKIQKLLANPTALPWVQEYLVHYQDFEMSNQLLCWNSLVKFREAGVIGCYGNR